MVDRLTIYLMTFLTQNQEFVTACKQNDLTSAKQLCLQFTNQEGKINQYQINSACTEGNLAVVKFFMEVGPEIGINPNPANCFKEAAFGGHRKILEYLAENYLVIDAEIINAAFTCSCWAGHLEVMEYLLTEYPEIEVDSNEIFLQSCRRGQLEVVRYLVRQFPPLEEQINSAFTFACQSESLELVQYLLTTFPEINVHANSDSALMGAYRNDRVNILRYLLENYCYDELDRIQYHKACMIACSTGKLRVAKSLHQNFKNVSLTPSNYAFARVCTHKHPELLMFLSEISSTREEKLDPQAV